MKCKVTFSRIWLFLSVTLVTFPVSPAFRSRLEGEPTLKRQRKAIRKKIKNTSAVGKRYWDVSKHQIHLVINTHDYRHMCEYKDRSLLQRTRTSFHYFVSDNCLYLLAVSGIRRRRVDCHSCFENQHSKPKLFILARTLYQWEIYNFLSHKTGPIWSLSIVKMLRSYFLVWTYIHFFFYFMVHTLHCSWIKVSPPNVFFLCHSIFSAYFNLANLSHF